ncbi:MAG: Bcr/CflA family efflux MFS transporter [Gammaproteobacteria bacterium]|nr:MAG: Bcr/CflA family efflux MFS transporter [Gammaproteobacteria bacterium]UTW41955.1 multidrug effflux MFS transporter [bacterium SCSIO 12844]
MPEVKNPKYLIVILAMYAALPPFAIDTYMPAFHQIAHYFDMPIEKVIVSITTYFIGFSVGMLIWGAISDRVGRKKAIIVGMFIYMVSTILCALSPDFKTLTIMRLIQGLGDSSGAVIAMAVARDCYSGKKLAKVIASMVIIMMAAPIIAPIVGSLIITFFGRWQDIFHFLTIYGVILFFLAFFIPETLKDEEKTSHLFKTVISYFEHLKNYRFILYSLSSGLSFAAFFTYISSSSVLIIGYFGYGYVIYCTIFGINFIGIISGQFLIKKKVDDISDQYLIGIGFIMCYIGVAISMLFTYVITNLFGFMLGIMCLTFGFALVSSLLTSRSLNALTHAFGAGNAINNLIKFAIAGLASYLISHFSGYQLMKQISFQQVIIISVALILFIINLYFLKKTSK